MRRGQSNEQLVSNARGVKLSGLLSTSMRNTSTRTSMFLPRTPLQSPSAKQYMATCWIDDTHFGQLNGRTNLAYYGRFNIECPVTDTPSPNQGTRNRHVRELHCKHLPFPATGDRARSVYISCIGNSPAKSGRAIRLIEVGFAKHRRGI